ncbi:MAG: hypothetical protein WD557_07055 [Dehalococcoidia bacterium]
MLQMHMRRLAWGAVALAGAAALAASQASAQIPQPPATVFGSVTDDAGPIAEGLRVEAYIGDKLCGEGETGFTGDGDAQVTVYYADVFSEQQTEGCGAEGEEVTLKIGERFATQTFLWEAGPIHLDVTFGSATPAPIPTRTPTPPRPTEAPASAEEPGEGAGAVETIPPGSPGAGSPVATSRGGVTSSDVGPGSGGGGDGGGGFPIWAVAIFLLGGLAVVGGGVGFAMSRNHADEDDDLFPRAPVE